MEITGEHQLVAVTEASQAASARHAARELAEGAGFDTTDAHRVGLVATELATNLVKHATSGGELLLRMLDAGDAPQIELIALDHGPGMHNVSQCLEDGHSTAGSPGTGLGAIRRLSDEFDIYSHRAVGTAVVARLTRNRRRSARDGSSAFLVSGVSIAKKGETVCGDRWAVRRQPDAATVLVADGLGHGLGAADAANAAVAVFQSAPLTSLVATLESVHDGIRHTRGAAAAVAELRRSPGQLKYAGVGNISGTVCADGVTRHAVSQNGTLGQAVARVREYSYPWQSNAVLVLHSDGLMSHWSLDRYPGLQSRHPSLIASILYRDFNRQRDDVTVLVVKEAP